MSDQSHQHGANDQSNKVVVDEGMRRWYKSCPCCMSAVYPEIKQRLDEEKWYSG